MVASETAGSSGGRSRRKRAAIAAAAVDAFLDRGFLGASMDDIAERAGASKATVYAHFDSKEQLFVEVVVATVKAVGDPVHDDVRDLADTDNLAGGLQVVARRQLDLVMTPRIVALRRLVIAEATRFPDVAQAFHDQGPARTIDALARTFHHLDDRGLLDCPDPTLAASQFNWLVMGAPMAQAMLLALTPEPAQLDRWTDAAVETFLATYGTVRARPPV